jgi:hypothetical protein
MQKMSLAAPTSGRSSPKTPTPSTPAHTAHSSLAHAPAVIDPNSPSPQHQAGVASDGASTTGTVESMSSIGAVPGTLRNVTCAPSLAAATSSLPETNLAGPNQLGEQKIFLKFSIPSPQDGGQR